MQILRGCFNGIGSGGFYLCLGVIPDYFRLINLTNTTYPLMLEWGKAMQKEVTCYGGIIYDASGVPTKLIASAGVAQYNGGDLMTSSNQTSTDYGNGMFLTWDHANYQADYVYGSGTNGTPLNKWTFVTGLTGNWNVAKIASGNRIGVGSRICIKEDSSGLVKEAYVTALTSDGEASAEVTLSRAIGTGAITFISGMYDVIPIALGHVAPAGVRVLDETVNVNDKKLYFEAFVD